MEVPFSIICGEKLSTPNTFYRTPIGKYDAINYGSEIMELRDIICLNDVDTKIYNFQKALELFKFKEVGLVFCKVTVKGGPQPHFYNILDNLRRKIHIAASGELMLIKRDLFTKLIPLLPCKAEDTYILFKTLELGYKIIFCEECWVETERTKTLKGEASYKKRTVSGIYQALSYTKPPLLTRFFYVCLPLLSPILLLFGKKGIYWMKGIIGGVTIFLLKDTDGKY
jgi:cellulose synthase/poly-beta-1,6-N-acetylglucosamine synthase-like glycosyltransferase